MPASRKTSEWRQTGECRIVPWYFGLMRAEFCERRDFAWPETGEVMEFQIRWVSAGRLPDEYDNSGAYGFWSTLSTPRDSRYGSRAIWRQLISYWGKIPESPDNAR
jgi:hypothetical protein